MHDREDKFLDTEYPFSFRVPDSVAIREKSNFLTNYYGFSDFLNVSNAFSTLLNPGRSFFRSRSESNISYDYSWLLFLSDKLESLERFEAFGFYCYD